MESTLAVARRKALRPPGVLVAGGAAIAPAVALRCDLAGFARVTLMILGPGEAHLRRRADETTQPCDAVVICATGEEAREVALEAIQGPAARAARACPDTVMILATPIGLDLAPAAASMTGLSPARMLATGGLPLAMRERRRIADRYDICASQCDVVVIGADAAPDLMLLPRYTRVAGIPVYLGHPAREPEARQGRR